MGAAKCNIYRGSNIFSRKSILRKEKGQWQLEKRLADGPGLLTNYQELSAMWADFCDDSILGSQQRTSKNKV